MGERRVVAWGHAPVDSHCVEDKQIKLEANDELLAIVNPEEHNGEIDGDTEIKKYRFCL